MDCDLTRAGTIRPIVISAALRRRSGTFPVGRLGSCCGNYRPDRSRHLQQGPSLQAADLAGANLTDAYVDATTVWPEGFNQDDCGTTLVGP